MRLPALIALRTGRGASVGGIALPSGASVATPGTPTVGALGSVVVLPGGPAPPVWAVADPAPLRNARTARDAESLTALPRPARFPRKLDLLRRPAGLAVGLALKEPAPPPCGGLAPESRVPRSRLRQDEIRLVRARYQRRPT